MSFAKTTMNEKTHEDVQCQSEDHEVKLRSQEREEDEEIEISHEDEGLPNGGKTDAHEEFLSSCNEGMLSICICHEELFKEKKEEMLEDTALGRESKWQEATESGDRTLQKVEEVVCNGTSVLFEKSVGEELPSDDYVKSLCESDSCLMNMKPNDHKEAMESYGFEEAKEEGKGKVDVMEEGCPPWRGAVVMFPTEDGNEISLEEADSIHCHGDMADIEEERRKRKEGKEKRKNEREEKEKRKMKKRWPMSHKLILSNQCSYSAGFMKFILQKRNEKMKKKDDSKEDVQERKEKNQMSDEKMKRNESSCFALSPRSGDWKDHDKEVTAFEEHMSKWRASHIDVEKRSQARRVAEFGAWSNHLIKLKMYFKKMRKRHKKRKRSAWRCSCSKIKMKIEKLKEELMYEDIEDDELIKFAAVTKMRGLLGKVKMKS